MLHFRPSPRPSLPPPRGGFHRLLTPSPSPTRPPLAPSRPPPRRLSSPPSSKSPRAAPRRRHRARTSARRTERPRLHLRPERPERLPDHLPDARVLAENFGVTLAWCGCPPSPSRSWYTSTWPLVAAPAPMPMVGTSSAAVAAAATAPGTHSRTIAKHPASAAHRAIDHLHRLVVAPPLGPEPAEDGDGLRGEADVAHHSDAGVDERPGGVDARGPGPRASPRPCPLLQKPRRGRHACAGLRS